MPLIYHDFCQSYSGIFRRGIDDIDCVHCGLSKGRNPPAVFTKSSCEIAQNTRYFQGNRPCQQNKQTEFTTIERQLKYENEKNETQIKQLQEAF